MPTLNYSLKVTLVFKISPTTKKFIEHSVQAALLLPEELPEAGAPVHRPQPSVDHGVTLCFLIGSSFSYFSLCALCIFLSPVS